MRFIIGVDIGGTFTDLVVVDEQSGEQLSHKSPSTPADPSEGMVTGLREIAERKGLGFAEFLADVRLIVHGTTVATNAVLTGRGAKTGLLTTEGFRDVLEMRRGIRSTRHLYDNKYVAPPPLVPRHLRRPVRERVDVDGAVVTPLQRQSVIDAVELLKGEDVDAIAICFAHGYANPEHELEAKRIVEELAPGCFLAVSSDVLPQIRAYNRVSTTAMSAYVGPVVQRYLQRLVAKLEDAQFGGVLMVMQSNGGVAVPETVGRLPVTTVLSGPAAGPVAGLAYARGRGSSDCIVIDMGGTSFDASLVKDGQVQLTREGRVNEQLVALPMTDIHTIGAGGGSIGWIDDGYILRMGPQSAGADPGPAAYGRGGTQPTTTDADVVLGYVDPDYFLGGRMRLRADLARAAIQEHIAEPLGLDVVEAAAGMYEVVNLIMAAGTKDISVQRGYDPREFPLIVAGGAGPVHAAKIAEELDIGLLVVPKFAPVFCAAGMLLADLRHDYVQTFVSRWDDVDLGVARAIVDQMVAQGREALTGEGVADGDQVVVVGADIRYLGQHHEVDLTFGEEVLAGDAALDRIADLFHARHTELFGFALRDSALEVINLRVTVLGKRRGFDLQVHSDGEERPLPLKGRRPVYLSGERQMVEVDVYDGNRMSVGQRVIGPAVVEEVTTTIFVPETFDLLYDRSGSFVMHKKGLRLDEH